MVVAADVVAHAVPLEVGEEGVLERRVRRAGSLAEERVGVPLGDDALVAEDEGLRTRRERLESWGFIHATSAAGSSAS